VISHGDIKGDTGLMGQTVFHILFIKLNIKYYVVLYFIWYENKKIYTYVLIVNT